MLENILRMLSNFIQNDAHQGHATNGSLTISKALVSRLILKSSVLLSLIQGDGKYENGVFDKVKIKVSMDICAVALQFFDILVLEEGCQQPFFLYMNHTSRGSYFVPVKVGAISD